jgi:septal ring factor EnvC (AmiA/AmiB activator)
MRLLSDAPNGAAGLWLTILVAVIGILPGLIAFLVAARIRREQRAAQSSNVGLAYTQTAFKSLEKEVTRMSRQIDDFDTERALWDHDRKVWAEDKSSLIRRISQLTEQLHVTNGYLQLLLVVLDANGIAPPKPPASLARRLPEKD